MSLFIPPASGPLPPVPELLLIPRRRVEREHDRERVKRHTLEGLIAFLRERQAQRLAKPSD